MPLFPKDLSHVHSIRVDGAWVSPVVGSLVIEDDVATYREPLQPESLRTSAPLSHVSGVVVDVVKVEAAEALEKSKPKKGLAALLQGLAALLHPSPKE